MSDNKPGEGWKANASGILVPPSSEKPCVEQAEFKVKVAGFVPQREPGTWDGEPVYVKIKMLGPAANETIQE